MTEEYADEIDDTLDDIERVVEDPSELYEHFRVVVDKGQSQVRIDKYLFERLVNSSRNRIQKAADAAQPKMTTIMRKRQAGKKQL